jgi:hypothetical protein
VPSFILLLALAARSTSNAGSVRRWIGLIFAGWVPHDLIRRGLPRSSIGRPAEGRSQIVPVEGSPCRSTVLVDFAVGASSSLCRQELRLSRDVPDETGQFSRQSGDDLLLHFATPEQFLVAPVQAVLRFPRGVLHLRR